MRPPPFSPLQLLLFIFAVLTLIAIVQIGLVTVAFDKLGLSSGSAFALLFLSLIGSAINVPLFYVKTEALQPPPPVEFFGLLRLPLLPFTGKTLITINVGGGVIPIAFSAYLYAYNPLSTTGVLLGIGVVTAISYAFSRPVNGVGIGMPVFIAPICAALLGMLLGGKNSVQLAYISGTLGVLMGADVFRFNDIRKMGLPMASIGGAGTFDGIFITGIVAVLLA